MVSNDSDDRYKGDLERWCSFLASQEVRSQCCNGYGCPKTKQTRKAAVKANMTQYKMKFRHLNTTRGLEINGHF